MPVQYACNVTRIQWTAFEKLADDDRRTWTLWMIEEERGKGKLMWPPELAFNERYQKYSDQDKEAMKTYLQAYGWSLLGFPCDDEVHAHLHAYAHTHSVFVLTCVMYM